MPGTFIQEGVTFVVLNTVLFVVGLALLGVLVTTFVHRWPRSTATLNGVDVGITDGD